MNAHVSMQDQARKANAQKSTGPKTEQGKAKSRENAVKHGLAGKGVCLPEDLQRLVENRRLETGAPIDHDDRHSVRLEDELVLATVLIDACRIERHQAITHRWDLDHEIEALELAAKIRSNPAIIAKKLERTAQGTRWLIEQLDRLIEVMEAEDKLEGEDLQLAYDLLGTAIRNRGPETSIEEVSDVLECFKNEIERLRAWHEDVLVPLEDQQKALAMVGAPSNETHNLKLLRRYERESVNRYMKLAAQLGLKAKPGPALTAARPPVPMPDIAQVKEPCVDGPAEEVNKPSPVTEEAAVAEGAPKADRDEPGDMSHGLEGSRGGAETFTSPDHPVPDPQLH